MSWAAFPAAGRFDRSDARLVQSHRPRARHLRPLPSARSTARPPRAWV